MTATLTLRIDSQVQPHDYSKPLLITQPAAISPLRSPVSTSTALPSHHGADTCGCSAFRKAHAATGRPRTPGRAGTRGPCARRRSRFCPGAQGTGENFAREQGPALPSAETSERLTARRKARAASRRRPGPRPRKRRPSAGVCRRRASVCRSSGVRAEDTASYIPRTRGTPVPSSALLCTAVLGCRRPGGREVTHAGRASGAGLLLACTIGRPVWSPSCREWAERPAVSEVQEGG